MKSVTISQVAKGFNISTRTLRYYEQIGLLQSIKKNDYAYRTYDDSAVRRLQQIIILRKLRIKLKEISIILQNDDAVTAIEVFRENLKEVNNEIISLTTIKSILQTFITGLSENINFNINSDLFNDDSVMKIIDSLTLSKINFKEERSMEELNKANEKLSRLKNVRIIYLPPSTVASSHFIGENPEDVSSNLLNDFIRNCNLHKSKPDLRLYGFNNPCPKDSHEIYGYEFWITIPDDMDVPEPLEKKHFHGGLYAAHCIKMGDFNEWQLIHDWVDNSDEYTFDHREPLGMGGSLEEHLNAYTFYQTDKENADFKQVDLLIPIKTKNDL
ncbi:effector binding domain-containing protein [Clostridium sp.]|uniref:effector binding domain-containing protein n=1 Tax=Clostridium sp. TaxID=1506 RepID=UPI003216FFD7